MAQLVFPGTVSTRIHRGQYTLAPAGTNAIFERMHIGRLRLGTELAGGQSVWVAVGDLSGWRADGQCKVKNRRF